MDKVSLEWGPQDESPGDERGPRACFSGTFCILRGTISSCFSGTYRIWNATQVDKIQHYHSQHFLHVMLLWKFQNDDKARLDNLSDRYITNADTILFDMSPVLVYIACKLSNHCHSSTCSHHCTKILKYVNRFWRWAIGIHTVYCYLRPRQWYHILFQPFVENTFNSSLAFVIEISQAWTMRNLTMWRNTETILGEWCDLITKDIIKTILNNTAMS